MRALAFPVILAVFVPAAALADEAACGDFKWPIASERQMLAAPGLPQLSSGGALAVPGQGAAVSLMPEANVAYAVKPARAPKANPSYGAELTLNGVAKAQVVQLTLSDEAWVDVVQNGKALHPRDYSGKAGCPGVRKSLRFNVVPGPVTIEISNAAAPSLKLAVTSVP